MERIPRTRGSSAQLADEDALPTDEELVRAWVAKDRPPQGGMSWPRARWIRAFPQHRRHFASLPDTLSRATVRQACDDAAKDKLHATRGFLAVMAWGFGSQTGYGTWRTARMLRFPDAPRRLLTAARAVHEGGALAGYAELASYTRCRIKWLGPAFGTKFLYFCSRPEDRALILDSVVAGFLNRENNAELSPVPWSLATYTRYMSMMRARASELGVTADELEQCLFEEESRRRNNQWSKGRR